MYSISPDCRPFVVGYDRLNKVFNDSGGFHDNTLVMLNCVSCHTNDGALTADYQTIEFETEDIKLRFDKVHGFSCSIPDVRSSFFFGIDFIVKDWCDYGKCIVMKTDGDCIMIAAERITVIE